MTLLTFLPIVYIFHITCSVVPPGSCCAAHNASPGAKYPIAALSVCICLITAEITAFCLSALLSETSLYSDRLWTERCGCSVFTVFTWQEELLSPCSEPPLHLPAFTHVLTNVQLTFSTLKRPYIRDLACFSPVIVNLWPMDQMWPLNIFWFTMKINRFTPGGFFAL